MIKVEQFFREVFPLVMQAKRIAGQLARREGKPRSSCPEKMQDYKKAWESGWDNPYPTLLTAL